METQEGILSADVMMDEEFNKAQSIADFRIRSMMCAPLIDSLGNSMGVLQIDTVRQAKRFQQEDLEVLLAVASQAGIAIDNAQMHETALRQRVVDRDLELAHEVQHGFLPDSRPEVEGYEFFDFYRPANQVGGDYYDYLRLPDGRVAVIVADVVGKGVAAALLMAKLSAEARFCLASAADAGEAVSMLNDRLCRLASGSVRDGRAGRCSIPPTISVSVANAGHMAPIVRHAGGTLSEPGDDEAGLPLGIMDGNGICHHHGAISVRAILMTMYTDGLNEAVSEANKFYFDRPHSRHGRSDGRIAESRWGRPLVEDVCEFIGQGSQSDDMCLVTFGRRLETAINCLLAVLTMSRGSKELLRESLSSSMRVCRRRRWPPLACVKFERLTSLSHRIKKWLH